MLRGHGEAIQQIFNFSLLLRTSQAFSNTRSEVIHHSLTWMCRSQHSTAWSACDCSSLEGIRMGYRSILLIFFVFSQSGRSSSLAGRRLSILVQVVAPPLGSRSYGFGGSQPHWCNMVSNRLITCRPDVSPCQAFAFESCVCWSFG